MREEQYIDHNGIRYWYVYRLAEDGEVCLGTTDPTKYCNGVYAYSRKDPGDGMAFVVIEERPVVRDEPLTPKIEGTTERIPQNE